MAYGSLGFNVVAALIKILFMILGFLMPLASILTWLERRQSAMMQDRLGPNRANIPLPWKWRGKRRTALGHHPLPGRRAEVHGQGGLRPRQGPQVPVHVGADHGDGARR